MINFNQFRKYIKQTHFQTQNALQELQIPKTLQTIIFIYLIGIH